MKTIRFAYENLIDTLTPDSTFTVTTSNANFPIANMQHYWQLRHHRTTSASAQVYACDFTSAQPISAFIIKNHNLTAAAVLRIQANSSNSFGGSTPVDVTIPITADFILNNIIVYFWETPESYRYWQWTITDASLSYIKIGRPYLGPTFAPAKNFNNQYTKVIVDPSIKNYSFGGQLSSVKRTVAREIKYGFEEISDTDQAIFEDMFYNHVRLTTPYFLCQDPDLASTKTYYVENTAPWSFTHVFNDKYFNLEVTVKESL